MIEVLLAASLIADRCAYEGPTPLALNTSAFTGARSTAALPAFTGIFDDAMAKAKPAALGVAVHRSGQSGYKLSTGIANNQLFHWASIGKSALAVVTLQLVDEGKLSLETTLDRWYPDLPYADSITIADLLSHKSGIYVADEDPDRFADKKQGFAARGYFHCPGQHFKYSNAGYQRLADIVEAVEGKSWQQSITDRIITPLGLTDMVAIDATNAARIAMPDGVAQLATTPGAAGGIAASPAAIAAYWSALMDGRLLPLPLRDKMVEGLYPMGDGNSYYGHGAMVFNYGGGDALYLIGHAGGMQGQNSILFYSPADDVTIAVAMIGESSAAAVANLYIKALRAQ